MPESIHVMGLSHVVIQMQLHQKELLQATKERSGKDLSNFYCKVLILIFIITFILALVLAFIHSQMT